ncbi:hypothetical protein B0H66DRAFT_598289 [Apodospora peruviana]|uniref:Uncharacterized protein n=1 Tax=Apodospora peruviana TaxID=516989 RepID=A0AAE0ITP4_9PEZI|nr:hypothetical protein B0H66DRAFT_598289 [Apodospora peruviana]
MSAVGAGEECRWMGELELEMDMLESKPDDDNVTVSTQLSPARAIRPDLANRVQKYDFPGANCIHSLVLGDGISHSWGGRGEGGRVEPVPGECSVLVMCHTRELAFQIMNEYNRFSKYMPDVKTGVFHGGTPIQKDPKSEQERADVQEILPSTPQQKQVMMFPATLSDETKPICRKFMQNPTNSLAACMNGMGESTMVIQVRKLLRPAGLLTTFGVPRLCIRVSKNSTKRSSGMRPQRD